MKRYRFCPVQSSRVLCSAACKELHSDANELARRARRVARCMFTT